MYMSLLANLKIKNAFTNKVNLIIITVITDSNRSNGRSGNDSNKHNVSTGSLLPTIKKSNKNNHTVLII